MAGGDVSFHAPPRIDVEADVVVIGAGACGLVAALRAKAAGAEVIVLERDRSPSGSTSMSSGFVPAPATRFQRAIGVDDDTPARFEADILAKSKGLSDHRLARLASRTIAPAIEWLANEHGLEWIVLDDFLYPGHSCHRMHAVAERTGAALLARLLAATERAGIPVVTNAHASRLFVREPRVDAVEVERANGNAEFVGLRALVLACNGYGGNRALVRRYIPEIADARYYGHAGNTGDALLWGQALGAECRHLSGYQGHGSLAHPHGILISWALMMEGAIQVNGQGKRFSNEHGGYSEQAVKVLRQPGGFAWDLFDERIHAFAQSFPDYREAVEAGAVRRAGDVAELSATTGARADELEATLAEVRGLSQGRGADRFGRDFTGKPPLKAPFYAVKVTGALFHTQGGLVIDDDARVLDANGVAFDNLLAGGGAACGVSGPDVAGYLSGNGLLTAIGFGYIAGATAARGRLVLG